MTHAYRDLDRMLLTLKCPIVAESGPSFQWFSRCWTVRFREKRTLNKNLTKSGHRKDRFTAGSGPQERWNYEILTSAC